MQLGYWPRSSVDDPKNIGGFFFPMYYDWTALLTMLGLPIFGAMLFTLTLICLVKRPEGWSRRLSELGFAVLLFFITTAILRWDPLRVVEWYFD